MERSRLSRCLPIIVFVMLVGLSLQLQLNGYLIVGIGVTVGTVLYAIWKLMGREDL